MKTAYCEHCGKETKFKKRVTLNSIIGLVLTLGLWVIVIIFSPSVCSECGTREHRNMDRKIYHAPEESL